VLDDEAAAACGCQCYSSGLAVGATAAVWLCCAIICYIHIMFVCLLFSRAIVTLLVHYMFIVVIIIIIL